MLPDKTQEQSLKLFEYSDNPIIKERQMILKVPEVNGKLTAIEKLVTDATTNPIIKELPQKHILEQIAILVPMICKDLGVVRWNSTKENEQYTKTRFYQTLTRYYSSLSIQSIKLAFDMLAVGQLDDYLPKDRNQQPEKNHFGEFSFEFYTRVLNAYVKRSADVWGKVRLNLPQQKNIISLEEQNKNKQAIIDDIYQAFDDYKNNNIKPYFHLQVHFNYLLEAGLIEKAKPTAETVMKAFVLLKKSNYISKLEKEQMKAEFEHKRQTHKFKSIINNQCFYLVVVCQHFDNHKLLSSVLFIGITSKHLDFLNKNSGIKLK